MATRDRRSQSKPLDIPFNTDAAKNYLPLRCRRDRVSLGTPRSSNFLEQQLLERLPRLNRLLLAHDHAVEEQLEALLEILDALQLEARHLALHQTRHMLELVLRVQHAALRLPDMYPVCEWTTTNGRGRKKDARRRFGSMCV